MTFISLDLLEMMLTPRLSWLRNIWHPSVFSTEMVGADPVTWTWTDWQLTSSTPATTESNTRPVLLHWPRTCTVQPEHLYTYTDCCSSAPSITISLLLRWCSTFHRLPSSSVRAALPGAAAALGRLVSRAGA